MKKVALLAVSVALVSSSANAATPPVFVYSGSSDVFLIQWTEANGQLTGSYQRVSIDRNNLPFLKTQNGAFTGTRQGSSVNLLFKAAVFGVEVGSVINGMVAKNTLTLNLPSASGGFSKVTFAAGTINAYNAATAKLKSIAMNQYQAAQAAAKKQAAATAAREAAEAKERSKLALDQDLADLQEAIRRASSLQSQADSIAAATRKALSSVPDGLKLLRQDLAEAQALMKSGASCDDIITGRAAILNRMEHEHLLLASDANTLATQSIVAKVNDLNADIRRAQTELPDLRGSIIQGHKNLNLPIPQTLITKADAALKAANTAAVIVASVLSLIDDDTKAYNRYLEAKRLIEQADSLPLPPSCQP